MLRLSSKRTVRAPELVTGEDVGIIGLRKSTETVDWREVVETSSSGRTQEEKLLRTMERDERNFMMVVDVVAVYVSVACEQ